MKFCILASGSSGNCTYIESSGARIVIDAGITTKKIKESLDEIGVRIDDIDAVCITHDHDDHIKGIPVLVKNHKINLYATEGTRTCVEFALKQQFQWNIFEAGSTFTIGNLAIHPFSTPHDAGDPVGFVVSDGISRLGIATDMGNAPAVVTHNLKNCHGLILEFNHDPDMLKQSGRPIHLQQRILGSRGHLSNNQAYELLRDIACEKLSLLALAHISAECNTPTLAMNAACAALNHCGCKKTSVVIPNNNFDVYEI